MGGRILSLMKTYEDSHIVGMLLRLISKMDQWMMRLTWKSARILGYGGKNTLNHNLGTLYSNGALVSNAGGIKTQVSDDQSHPLSTTITLLDFGGS